jgi:hypothetical protein
MACLRWDTKRENDGGAVFDAAVRKFLAKPRPHAPACATLTVSNPATFGPLREFTLDSVAVSSERMLLS